MYSNKKKINHVVKIFKPLLTCKQDHLSFQVHFARLQALLHEVNLCQPPTTDPVMQKHYREELYPGIYQSKLHPSILSLTQRSLLFGDRVSRTIVLGIMYGTPSSPLSFVLGDMTPPSTMTIFALKLEMIVSFPTLMAVVLLIGATATLFFYVLVVPRKIIIPKYDGRN